MNNNLLINLFLLIIIFIIILISIYIQYKTISLKLNETQNIKELFIDEEEINQGVKEGEQHAQNIETKEQDPSLNKLTKDCKPNNKLEFICMNKDVCCQYDSNECYCNHPITKKCVEQYDKCKQHLETSKVLLKYYNKEGIEDICNIALGKCCSKFNDVKPEVKYNKYNNKKIVTKLNKYCSLGVKDNLPIQCKKMCSTYDKCRGYIADDYGCTLFDDIKHVNIVPGSYVKGKQSPKQKSVKGYNIMNLMIKQ